MTLAHPDMDSVIEFTMEKVNTLVIENRDFFRGFLRDISDQLAGHTGKVVLAEGVRLLEFSRNAELLDSFLSFTLNRKTLLTKIATAMEKAAVSEEHYPRTAELLTELERYFYELADEFSCPMAPGKITPPSLIKMLGVSIEEEYNEPLEQILDYMELVREFDRDRLFIFVNMRGYFSDESMEHFLETVLSHEYTVLLVDAFAAPLLSHENRLTVDEDLCEF